MGEVGEGKSGFIVHQVRIFGYIHLHVTGYFLIEEIKHMVRITTPVPGFVPFHSNPAMCNRAVF